MSNPAKKSNATIQTLEECKRAEAATKTRLDSAIAKGARLRANYDNPDLSETLETLAQLRKEIAAVDDEVRLAKANHERAVAARNSVEAELTFAEDRLRRVDLEKRLEEAATTMPPAYRRLAEQLLVLVVNVHQLNEEIGAYNKARPTGADFIPTFEQRVRWTEPSFGPHGVNGKQVRTAAIYPAQLAAVFEIPALQNGDSDYRVPGTVRPVGIWIDVNGHPRR